MSIPHLSNSELRALVRQSETFCDAAQAELDRRERRQDFRHGHEAGPVASERRDTWDAGPAFSRERRQACFF